MPRFGSLLLLVLFTPLAVADDKSDNHTLGRKFDRVELTDLDSKTTRLDALQGKQATVVIFLSFECPVSNSYTTLLGELAKTYSPRGVSFVAVCPTDDSVEQIRKRIDEYKLSFPVFIDSKRTTAKALAATMTPEALLLDSGL